MAKVLVVEDDQALAGMVERYLEHEHHTAEVVFDGEEAVQRLITYSYDAVVLDLDLPKLSGLEVCRVMRGKGIKTPTIILTGKSTLKDKVEGFDSGADDYLTKPFELEELAVRVRALLRRAAGQAADLIQHGEIVLDAKKKEVSLAGKVIDLTEREFALLDYFMRHPGECFRPEALLDRLWRADDDVSIASVRQLIKRLREKIGDTQEKAFIKNVHGMGYKLQVGE